MKRLILFIFLASGVLFGAGAREYRQFVEEGKTWWYETINYGMSLSATYRSYEGITMRGDTVIDDVTWKKCYTIDIHKKLSAEPLVLMREDGKKVYSRAMRSAAEHMHTECGEYLVYDFSLETDDIYSFFDSEENSYDNYEICVRDRGEELQGDEVFRYQMAGFEYIEWDKRKCVEGIGCVDYEYFYQPFYQLCACIPTYITMLTWVTDKDNNVIYEAVGGRKPWEYAPPMAPKEFTYKPMGEEGKTWWYTSKKADGDTEYGITVCGDTIVDGMAWKKLYFVNAQLQREPSPVAIIRDEDKRVYATCLAHSTAQLPDYAPDYLELERIVNTCIYDFNLAEDGATATTVGSIGSNFIIHCLNAAYVENSGNWFRRNLLRYATSLNVMFMTHDGVGCDFATLFFVPILKNSSIYEKNATLRWVTDAAGNIVYTGAGGLKLWEENSVSLVPDGAEGDAVYYNLQGLPVPAHRLEPGIYVRVRGGKACRIMVR